MFIAAAIQFHPQLGKLQENIQRLEEAVAQAASAGAKFIVTPELAVSGYMYETREEILAFTDTVPGTVTKQLHSLCLHWNIYLVVGMPEYEEETGLLYNSAVLIGPEGLIGKYRKTHLWEAEAHWATPGNLGFPVFSTELGNIAINICMDAVYMESSRIPALHGADILAFPTNSSAQTISMLQGWATLNGMYIVSANRADEEKGFQMAGASAIWSPFGEKINEAKTSLDGGEEEIIYGAVHPEFYQNPNRARLLNRRPELYRNLMLHIGPWNSRKTADAKQINVKSFAGPILPLGEGGLEGYYQYWKGKISSLSLNSRQDNLPTLAVLPALSATGAVDHFSYEEIVLLGQSFAVEWLPKYRQLAFDMKTNLIVSAPECAEGHMYLSAWFIKASGETAEVHRCTHLREETNWTPGEKITVITTEELGKVGILFEEEAYFPEMTSSCGIQRVDILALLAETASDEEYPPLIDARFHANEGEKEGLKAVWENLSMSIQAYTAFAGWQTSSAPAAAVYAVDGYYEKEASVLAGADGIAAKRISTIRSSAWYNQQQWVVSRRVEFYYPLIARIDSPLSIFSTQEEEDMMA